MALQGLLEVSDSFGFFAQLGYVILESFIPITNTLEFVMPIYISRRLQHWIFNLIFKISAQAVLYCILFIQKILQIIEI